jgi:DNA-directed RNA polymerase
VPSRTELTSRSSSVSLLPTHAEISAQVDLEREQIRQGLEKIRDNTQKLEDKEYASATAYGVASIEQLLPLVVARIQRTANRIKEGKTGVAFREIQQYLADIEPQAAAAIACKVTFDKVFATKKGASLVPNVTDSIGQAVENECMMRHYERKVPGLLHTLKENYFHRASGTHQKVKVITTLMNRYDVPHWQCWGRGNRVKLGGWLLDCICKESNWFLIDMRQHGNKRTNYVIPSPAFMQEKDKIMEQVEMFSPLAWPMLIPPNDWDETKPGGYLLNEVMRGYDMVRRGDPTCIQGEQRQ